MKTELADMGERMIPSRHKNQNKYGAHLARYQASLVFTKGKTVLDIACGTGYGSKLMASQAKKVYGVDLSVDAIEYAKKNYSASNVEYKIGDCTDIPLGDNEVDVVVSYETIEHIDDYRKFMREIKRVLKSSGTLLISTPNKIESGGDNPFHFHEFTFDEFKKILSEYFDYHKNYFQTLWLYNSILSESQQTSEYTKTL